MADAVFSRNTLPPGWERVEKVSSSGMKYARFTGPGGIKAQSIADAWRMTSDQ